MLYDIMRRYLYGSEPESLLMILMGMAALVANITCLTLIYKYRKGEVHMRASWIFSKSDVVANLGVIAGGLLVAYFNSPYPDLIIGCIIVYIVTRGGITIIHEASKLN